MAGATGGRPATAFNGAAQDRRFAITLSIIHKIRGAGAPIPGTSLEYFGKKKPAIHIAAKSANQGQEGNRK